MGKEGTPSAPAGAANMVPAACETRVAVVVPDEVIGEPDTEKMFGRTVATEVTVPEDPAAQIGTPDPFKVSTWPLDPPVICPTVPEAEAKRTAFVVYEERPVPPRATAKTPEVICEAEIVMPARVEVGKVPEVICEASRSGISAATNALKDGCPVEPSGEAKTLFCVWFRKAMFTFPLEVTGELVEKTDDGAVTPTEVTVPAEAFDHAGAPDTTVKTWPFVPTEERPVPPWDTPKTPEIEEVERVGMRAILNTPEVIFEASRFGMEEVARVGLSVEK